MFIIKWHTRHSMAVHILEAGNYYKRRTLEADQSGRQLNYPLWKTSPRDYIGLSNKNHVLIMYTYETITTTLSIAKYPFILWRTLFVEELLPLSWRIFLSRVTIMYTTYTETGNTILVISEGNKRRLCSENYFINCLEILYLEDSVDS